ncbi:hypothetical protein ZOSMA_166G00230 [Zostera marina]|uniref:F-box domain-containing protein n=1 Tax=Zostera marina TaxID=29655 RepID=A0A0K9PTF6_ZOSMR|nr:hypothetical protein ZOSMA_166G00230 [Zostera marina]
MITGEKTTNIEDLHDEILFQILRFLDGPALATTSCTTPRLQKIATDHDLWQQLCLSSFPSLRQSSLLLLQLNSNYQSFFSNVYPFSVPNPEPVGSDDAVKKPIGIFCAIDIHHKDDLIFSKLVEINLRSQSQFQWFLSSPFHIDVYNQLKQDEREHAPINPISPEELTLSWIVIVPTSSIRAANLSSRRPVSINKNPYTEETNIQFATVIGDYIASAMVTYCSETMQLLEVSLNMKGQDGAWLNGKDTLVAMRMASEGKRIGNWKEENVVVKVKERYWEYEKIKKEKMEKRVRIEWTVDMLLVLASVFIFFGFTAHVSYT